MFALAFIYPGELIEVAHFASHLHRNFGRIKTRDTPYSAFAGEGSRGERLFADAIRANYTHAGNDCPSEDSTIL